VSSDAELLQAASVLVKAKDLLVKLQAQLKDTSKPVRTTATSLANWLTVLDGGFGSDSACKHEMIHTK
jgi:hypothetical protein